MYDEFRDRAELAVVYIAEAHPEDGWQTTSNRTEGVVIRQHTSLAERRAAAQRCARELELSIPMFLDSMDDAAGRAFSAWPERIYVIGADRRIAYQGGHGPYDFNPDEGRAALDGILRSK